MYKLMWVSNGKRGGRLNSKTFSSFWDALDQARKYPNRRASIRNRAGIVLFQFHAVVPTEPQLQVTSVHFKFAGN